MFRVSDFYKGVDEVAVCDFNPYDGCEVVADVEQAKFYKLVFAPDPETGNPCSDVSYLLSGTDDGFKQYIKEKLFQPNPSGAMAEDSEVAEAMIKPNILTSSAYAEYAKEYVSNMLRSESEKGE